MYIFDGFTIVFSIVSTIRTIIMMDIAAKWTMNKGLYIFDRYNIVFSI